MDSWVDKIATRETLKRGYFDKKTPEMGRFYSKIILYIEYQRIMRKCAKVSGKSAVLFD